MLHSGLFILIITHQKITEKLLFQRLVIKGSNFVGTSICSRFEKKLSPFISTPRPIEEITTFLFLVTHFKRRLSSLILNEDMNFFFFCRGSIYYRAVHT